jgi:FeS assembly protein IscX
MDNVLTWEDTYAIAIRLKAKFPDFPIEWLSLRKIYDWTVELPEFDDDPEMANDTILLTILKEWFEEANT